MSPKLAKEVVGGLGEPKKMPCYSYGLSATACRRGAKLALIPGSVCHHCYAQRGHYTAPTVKAAHQRRMLSLTDPDWVEAMSTLLYFEDHFRWHDSGDLQGLEHLNNIIAVAENCLNTKFWMPTHEVNLVRDIELPSNLCVRLSSDLIDYDAHDIGLPTSTVHTKVPIGVECPAPKQGGKCGSCRQCWDKGVDNISYRKH